MMKYFVALLILGVVSASPAREERRATVFLKGKEGVQGHLIFAEVKNGVKIEGQITGLSPGKHGFHVHAKGDLSNGCASTAGHFNPHNKSHGGREAEDRHVGDLGNIEADQTGVANVNIVDHLISLHGAHNILGRAVVVHADEDDYGKGGHSDSLTTGHAGDRVACGIIGILSPENDFYQDLGASSSSSLSHSLITTGLAVLISFIIF